MFPPNRSTADWPAHINGTSTTTNASDNVDRDNHPSPGIQKVTPVKYMSANSPGSSGLPVEGSRVPRKSPRDDRPAQEAQKTTQIKQKITFVRINTPNNPPGSGVGSYTPAKHQLANTPGSSNPPVQFSPTRVRGPSCLLCKQRLQDGPDGKFCPQCSVGYGSMNERAQFSSIYGLNKN